MHEQRHTASPASGADYHSERDGRGREVTTTSGAGALERLGTFPPITNDDWRNMFLGQPTPINFDAARMVYDIAWFLVKDRATAEAIAITTFKVALSRLGGQQNAAVALPPPAAYTAWLASIANNEAHRILEEAAPRRKTSALMLEGNERDALFCADALAELRADDKLAMILKYRYNTPPSMISVALDMRPRRLARHFVDARQEWARHSTLPPATLATATPPDPIELPRSVQAYAKRDLKHSRLGYAWNEATDFPTIPMRDERREKWLTALAALVIVVLIMLAATRPWNAERPELVDPNSAPEIGLVDSNSAGADNTLS